MAYCEDCNTTLTEHGQSCNCETGKTYYYCTWTKPITPSQLDNDITETKNDLMNRK
jgi:hypothetical protein